MTVEVVSGAARSAMFAKTFCQWVETRRLHRSWEVLVGNLVCAQRAPGFDGAAGSAKLRKNADRATLLHVTIL
jgi:hypothetical protein